jgi:hypothetical protein
LELVKRAVGWGWVGCGGLVWLYPSHTSGGGDRWVWSNDGIAISEANPRYITLSETNLREITRIELGRVYAASRTSRCKYVNCQERCPDGHPASYIWAVRLHARMHGLLVQWLTFFTIFVKTAPSRSFPIQLVLQSSHGKSRKRWYQNPVIQLR